MCPTVLRSNHNSTPSLQAEARLWTTESGSLMALGPLVANDSACASNTLQFIPADFQRSCSELPGSSRLWLLSAQKQAATPFSVNSGHQLMCEHHRASSPPLAFHCRQGLVNCTQWRLSGLSRARACVFFREPCSAPASGFSRLTTTKSPSSPRGQ